ncbi:MAG TPA: tetratricopeptide repeat protein [Bacteroidales bacterium]|nr:tetratricopeptide repeat protein [Bacteroidales bacterium]HRT46557.1 tetratricopeptide repeat protein [Bacteroidales bacterium]
MKKKMWTRKILIISVIGLIFTSISSLYSQDLNTAIHYTKSEAYDRAQEVFKQLIQNEPNNSRYYFYYGENWIYDYFSDTISNSLPAYMKEAKALFEKGVSANPNFPLNYVGLAKVAFYMGDNKTADEMRAKARSLLIPNKNIKKLQPPAKDYALTLAKMAESYINVKFQVDTSKALPLIREALRIDYKNPEIYIIAGDIYNLVNDGSNAVKNYNLAQDYDPTSPTANMKIGSIYVRAKNLQAAIPYFENAINLDPNYAPAYRELGSLYSMARRYDQAKQYYEKYLELTKGNIPAKISYVRSLYFAGEYDQVIKNVDEIFAVDQSKAYLNRLAAYSCYENKNPDYDKALKYMETLFEKVSPELIIKRDYTYLAKILLKKNANYQNLIKESERLKTQLDKERSRYNAASAAEKAKMKPLVDTLNAQMTRINRQISNAEKEIDRAFDAYNKALSYDPEDIALINEIAINYYDFRKYEDAARMWAKLIQLGKNDVNDYMRVGRAFYVAENYKSADSIFSIVTKIQPDYLQAHLYIARTYSKMEKEPKEGLAKPKFEKVIQVAASDSLKNEAEMIEAFGYLAYYYKSNGNYQKARDYYNRMINLNSNNNDNKTKGYLGLASIEVDLAINEKTIEGKLPFLGHAQDYYKQILAYDSSNEQAKSLLKWTQDYEAQVKKGINPNELKGIVKTASGQPIANASVRVKDTAAETYTNTKGEFKFEIPQASEALIVSAPGFQPKEIPIVRPLKPLTITLEQ